MPLLDGRVVLVTGGGRGLGRAHCLELAARGATVVVNDLPDQSDDPAAEVAKEIESAGGTAVADATSVTDFEAVRALIDGIVNDLGHLDAVVNNAGILRDRMLVSMTEDEFDAVLAVHVKGTFCVTHHAANHWRSLSKAGTPGTGRVINTTSGAGLWGNVGQIAYSAAKAAIVAMTSVSAMELANYGVTVNAISPIARTRMTAGLGLDADLTAGVFDRFDPANASPVVAWLASASSGWLTGSVLRIEGETVAKVAGHQVDPATRTLTGPAGTRLEATELDLALRRSFGLAPTGLPGS